jgi:flagellar assembly factor FliW
MSMPEPTSTLPAPAPLAAVPQLLRFEHGLPGFPDSHRFALVTDADADAGACSPFALLRSLDDDDLAFVVTHPFAFFPDYAVDLDDATLGRLELEDADDAVVLLIVTLGPTLAATTANLLGPIVVNCRNRRAIQAIATTSPYDAQTPLYG